MEIELHLGGHRDMASTSKELHHKTYYWSAYEGPSMQCAVKSINDLILDDCKVLFPDTYQELDLTRIQNRNSLFLYRIDSRLRNATSAVEAAEIADLMKEDKTSIQNLVTSLFRLEYESCLFGVAYGPRLDRCRDLYSRCPYYVGKQGSIFAFDEDFNICSEIEFKLRLKESKLLALNIINMVHIILNHSDGKLSEIWRSRQLLFDMCAPAHIFECMNPTGEVEFQQEVKTLEILTDTHVPMDDSTRNRLDLIYASVIEDIKDGKLPYIKDMHKAYTSLQLSRSERYTPEDFYVSMKATPQRYSGGPKESILNSVFEHDTLKEEDATKAFDEMVGYQSSYVDTMESNTPKYCIKTLLIRNGGKFKMRAIHIAENAIQDRCNWIHKKLVKALRCLASDCSKDQMKGRRFLQQKTLLWNLTPEESEKEGIYCFDFSNATDTMSQNFQYSVLNDLFCPEVANYWRLLSITQKHFFSKFVDDPIPYTQSEGQPQGLLGSFDAFSLGHHIMMLMVMKMCGLEQFSASKCYTVLGDDSVLTTVIPEYEHQDFPVYEAYKLVCEYANFIVNIDKSKLIHADSEVAEADFAKVTYINGSMCTPTPFRLALRYSSGSMADHIAVALWKISMDSPNHKEFAQCSLANEQYGSWVLRVLKSGLMPSLIQMKEGVENSSFVGRASYCIALSSLDSTVAHLLSGDKELAKIWKDPCGFDMLKSLDCSWIDKAPRDHKIWDVIEEEESKIEVWKTLYGADTEDSVLALLVGAMSRNIAADYDKVEEDLLQLQTIMKILASARVNPNYDVSEVFPEASESIAYFCKEISELIILRGSTKKPRKIGCILENAYALSQELDILLGNLV